MNVKKKIAALVLALMLVPVFAMAEDMEMKATVVSKGEKEIKVTVKGEEKTLRIGRKTKGVDNATEGSKVTIKYSEKDGQLRATEITPR